MMLIVCLSLVALVSAVPTGPPNMNVAFKEAFKQVDINHDGHIDVSEFMKIFDAYDSNHDGMMSLDEYIQNTKVDRTFAKAIFKFIDSDGDDSIPRSDIPRIYKLYDTNNDGLIESPEFVAEYVKIFNAVVKQLGYIPTAPPQ